MAERLDIPISEKDFYFISYNLEDAERVSKIVQLMHQQNIPMWYDRGIKYGRELEEEIATHVRQSKAVLIFLTKGVFQKSRSNVLIEYEMAKIRNRPIYIIFLDEVEYDIVPDNMLRWVIEISKRQSVPYTLANDLKVLIEEITRMLCIPLQTTNDTHFGVERIVGNIENDDITDPIKQNNIGDSYYYGRNGLQQSYKEAVKWYLKAAGQGSVNAQCSLGYCYEMGEGVAQNGEEAVKWWRKAADQGDVFAQYCLGLCYRYGTGVEKSISEALKWYQKVADIGDKRSK